MHGVIETDKGPIEQTRFLWFIGADWETDLYEMCLNDAYLPCPAYTACQGLQSAPIAQSLERLVAIVLDRVFRNPERKGSA